MAIEGHRPFDPGDAGSAVEMAVGRLTRRATNAGALRPLVEGLLETDRAHRLTPASARILLDEVRAGVVEA